MASSFEKYAYAVMDALTAVLGRTMLSIFPETELEPLGVDRDALRRDLNERCSCAIPEGEEESWLCGQDVFDSLEQHGAYSMYGDEPA